MWESDSDGDGAASPIGLTLDEQAERSAERTWRTLRSVEQKLHQESSDVADCTADADDDAAFHRSRGIPSRDVGTEVPTYDEWYDAFPFMRLVGTTIHEPTSVGTPARADHMVECGDDITSPVPPVRGPHVVQGAFVAQGRACRIYPGPAAALASEEVEEVFASDGAIEEVLAMHVNSATTPNARAPGHDSFLCANGDGSDPERAIREELLLPLFDALWVDVVSEMRPLVDDFVARGGRKKPPVVASEHFW